MLEAVDRVIDVTGKTSKDQFLGDWMIQDVLIRELEVLGEAAGRVTQDLTSEYAEIPWARDHRTSTQTDPRLFRDRSGRRLGHRDRGCAGGASSAHGASGGFIGAEVGDRRFIW